MEILHDNIAVQISIKNVNKKGPQKNINLYLVLRKQKGVGMSHILIKYLMQQKS